MKQILEGQIYEIIPLNNGIIFSYCKESLENKVIVGYRMISFDSGRITDIAKNAFLGSKYGTNYQEIIKKSEHYITDKVIHLQNGRMLIYSKNGVLKLIDANTEILWQGTLSYRNYNASDFIIHKNSIWTCFSDCNALLRYSLNTMREELRIGGRKSPFSKPKSIFSEGEEAYVCNADSQKILKVNLENYSVSEYLEFGEEVTQYVKADIYEFVILKSGLYML